MTVLQLSCITLWSFQPCACKRVWTQITGMEEQKERGSVRVLSLSPGQEKRISLVSLQGTDSEFQRNPSWEVWGGGRGGAGRGVLLSQRGAAGSCKDVCSTHPCTSQQLGRLGMGIRGPQDQPRGGAWRAVRLITAPQIPPA